MIRDTNVAKWMISCVFRTVILVHFQKNSMRSEHFLTLESSIHKPCIQGGRLAVSCASTPYILVVMQTSTFNTINLPNVGNSNTERKGKRGNILQVGRYLIFDLNAQVPLREEKIITICHKRHCT